MACASSADVDGAVAGGASVAPMSMRADSAPANEDGNRFMIVPPLLRGLTGCRRAAGVSVGPRGPVRSASVRTEVKDVVTRFGLRLLLSLIAAYRTRSPVGPKIALVISCDAARLRQTCASLRRFPPRCC